MIATHKQDQILDIAESIVCERGFNAFSYADVALELGASKASVHHHFPTKGHLGLELVNRFSNKVRAALEEIALLHSSNIIKLREYARLYETALEENKMCLCGMLAAEHETLTDPMRQAINDFFTHHETWVAGVLNDGKGTGEISFDGTALDHARLIVSNIQGALLLSKSLRSIDRIRSVTASLIGIYAVQRT